MEQHCDCVGASQSVSDWTKLDNYQSVLTPPWHPLLNISNHSNTPLLWTLWLAAAPWLTKNWLTCQYWGVWGSNNTTTAFWTHSFSLFCQKYLLIVCVRSQIPLPQVPQGAWNKKLISWLGWLRFLCLGWWPSADQGSYEGSGLDEWERAWPSPSHVKLKPGLRTYYE